MPDAATDPLGAAKELPYVPDPATDPLGAAKELPAGDFIPSEQPGVSPISAESHLRNRLKQERTWEDVAPELKKAGLDPERYRQGYQLGEAHAVQSQQPLSTSEAYRKIAPFGFLGDTSGVKAYGEARKRYDEGKGTKEDAHVIAEHERIQRQIAGVNESFAGRVVSGVGGLSQLGAEMGAGGAALGPVATYSRPLRALGFGEGAVGTATSRAGQLGQFGLRRVGQTAVAPSMYVEPARQANIAAGREADDIRGYPTAIGMAYANNLVLGGLQSKVGAGLPGGFIGRTAVKGSLGAGEAAGVEAGAGVADEFLNEAYKTNTKYGPIGKLFGIRQPQDVGGGLKDLAATAVTFSLFSGLHGAIDKPELNKAKAKEALDKAVETIDSAKTPEEAAQKLKDLVAETKPPVPETKTPAGEPVHPLDAVPKDDLKAIAGGLGVKPKDFAAWEKTVRGNPGMTKAIVEAALGEQAPKPPEPPRPETTVGQKNQQWRDKFDAEMRAKGLRTGTEPPESPPEAGQGAVLPPKEPQGGPGEAAPGAKPEAGNPPTQTPADGEIAPQTRSQEPETFSLNDYARDPDVQKALTEAREAVRRGYGEWAGSDLHKEAAQAVGRLRRELRKFGVEGDLDPILDRDLGHMWSDMKARADSSRESAFDPRVTHDPRYAEPTGNRPASPEIVAPEASGEPVSADPTAHTPEERYYRVPDYKAAGSNLEAIRSELGSNADRGSFAGKWFSRTREGNEGFHGAEKFQLEFHNAKLGEGDAVERRVKEVGIGGQKPMFMHPALTAIRFKGSESHADFKEMKSLVDEVYNPQRAEKGLDPIHVEAISGRTEPIKTHEEFSKAITEAMSLEKEMHDAANQHVSEHGGGASVQSEVGAHIREGEKAGRAEAANPGVPHPAATEAAAGVPPVPGAGAKRTNGLPPSAARSGATSRDLLNAWVEAKRNKAAAPDVERKLKAQGFRQTEETIGAKVKVDRSGKTQDIYNTGGSKATGDVLRRGWIDKDGHLVQKPLVEPHAMQDDKSAHLGALEAAGLSNEIRVGIENDHPDWDREKQDREYEKRFRVWFEHEGREGINDVNAEARRSGAKASEVEAAIREVAHDVESEVHSTPPEEIAGGNSGRPVADEANHGEPVDQPSLFGDAAGDFNPADLERSDFGRPMTGAEKRTGLVGGGQPNAGGEEPIKQTALANAVTDKEREKNGLSPLMGPARMENMKVWDEAMRAIDENPRAETDLIDKLAAKPRVTTVQENALLLHRRIALSNEHGRAIREAIAAHAGKADPHELDRLDAREASLMAEIDRLDDVIHKTGSEWGRAGQFRRQLAREDFSLSTMLGRAEIAKGTPLTVEEKAEITGLHDKLRAAEAALAAAEAVPGLAGKKGEKGDITDLRIATRAAKRVYAEKINDMRWENMPTAKKLLYGTKEAFNASRSLITAFDLSGLLRQGGILSAAHPFKAINAIPEMLRAFASERGAERALQELKDRGNGMNMMLYNRDKLAIMDHRGPASAQEEAFIGRWVSKIPGVAASARAYTTILNRLRADVYDSLAGLSRGKQPTPQEGAALAHGINVLSGRGSLGEKTDKVLTAMSPYLFSPRFLLSRFQVLTGQPLYGGTMKTRLLLATEYARFIAGAGVIYALASLNDDAKITFDPRSTDFGKIRFGNTRVDPLAGLAQVATFVFRVGLGEEKNAQGQVVPLRNTNRYSATGKPGKETVGSVILRFIRSKGAPVPTAIADPFFGENVVGEPTTPVGLASHLMVPMSVRDVYESLTDQGVPRGAAIALLAILGMGTQTYEPGGAGKTQRGLPPSALQRGIRDTAAKFGINAPALLGK